MPTEVFLKAIPTKCLGELKCKSVVILNINTAVIWPQVNIAMPLFGIIT